MKGQFIWWELTLRILYICSNTFIKRECCSNDIPLFAYTFESRDEDDVSLEYLLAILRLSKLWSITKGVNYSIRLLTTRSDFDPCCKTASVHVRLRNCRSVCSKQPLQWIHRRQRFPWEITWVIVYERCGIVECATVLHIYGDSMEQEENIDSRMQGGGSSY